ncbi:helix-turn-helix domain-containing protein [Cohnella sp. GCM10020058]|uniref:helix-turn-helix domain-containing protein n=1 Tax=Cohnella sp. GCM10020058 TaxID=3317330 RepID=UPI00362BD1AA
MTKRENEKFIRALEISHKLDFEEHFSSDPTMFASSVAELLGVSVATVYSWLRMGELQGRRVLGLWYIDRKSVIELAKVKGHYSQLTPGWYVSRGSRRYVVKSNVHEVQYGTPGGATRYCKPLEFIEWLRDD